MKTTNGAKPREDTMLTLRFTAAIRIANWDELPRSAQDLLRHAITARRNANAPVSNFNVGAALRTRSGTTHRGCNVEDMGYNGTIHGEAGAIAAMVAELGPKARISAVAIVLGPKRKQIICPPQRRGPRITRLSKVIFSPCGNCRPLLARLSIRHGQARVYALQPNGQVAVTTVRALYPLGFFLDA